jgi:preflagellin peptidase FlaK
MIEELFVSLAILGTLIAGITDLKWGIIPNKVTFPLICIGVIGHLSYSLFLGNFYLFFLCMQNVLIILAFGYLFWLLGGWSAGDAKEFLFIAALVPRYPHFLLEHFNPNIPPYPFIISVLANTLISIFPFILIFSLTKTELSKILESFKDIKKYTVLAAVLVAASAISKLTGITLLGLIFLIALIKLKNKSKVLISIVVLLSYILQVPSSLYEVSLYFMTALIALIMLRVIWNSITVIRKEALQETMKISDIDEGMVLAEEIYIDRGKVFREEKSLIDKILEAIRTKNLDILKKKGISTGAAGVTREEVELLKKYVREGKLEDRIKIKKSMPFAPVIAIGLILSLIFGDLPLSMQELIYG